jgi:DNA polymerase III alpha subunit/intein/homing endonuclease
MAKNQFVHLHCHTGGSVLDGHANVDEMVQEAARLGQPAIAATDHGTMHFSYDLWKAAKDAGIKGIVGIEAYVTPGDASRTEKQPIFFGAKSKEERMEGAQDVSAGGAYTHMTMLAENNEGMHNLFKLSSLAWSDGYYKKPRMDMDIISQYAKGIIATTGCPSGELQTRLRLGQWDEAVKYVDKMQNIFGRENYFLELMDHDMKVDIERVVKDDLLKIGKHMNIPLLATNDLHYTRRDQARSHEQMLAVQSGSKMTDLTYDNGGKRFAFDGDEFYVKSADEMESVFGHLPTALTNTLLIAERCDVSFEARDDLRPNVEFPEGMSETEFIRSETLEGLRNRLPQFANDPRYLDRLDMELRILDMKGYNGYFLVTSDFVRWARNNGVEVGYGRGCLSADANILTPNGFVKIKDIKVGDIVFNEYGEQIPVPEVFEYDCDEELIEIKAFYGGNGNKMTADHKVLVSKAVRETNKSKIAQGIKFSSEINEPKWIRADEVEVGDLVVTPKIQLEETDEAFEVEPVSITMANAKYSHSVREIAKSLNVARSTVMKFFASEGAIKGDVSQRIHDYFVENNLNIQEEISKRLVVKTLPVSKVEKNFDAGFVFGLFISDGWIRSDRDTEVGFAQRRSEDEGQIPDAFRKVFGVELTPYHHKDSDLTQYTYNHKGIAELFADLFPEYQFNAQTKYIPDALLNSPEEFRKGLLEGLWYGDGTHKGKSSYGTASKRLAEDVYLLLLSLGMPASLKSHERTELRPEFNKSQRESFTEYKVGTAKDFDLSKIRNGKGFDGKFNYYRVREINVVPAEGKVYDFTVPGSHSYVTDSYVVHNSAGGSLVSYCLDITDLDPIRHDLLFERFINPERDSPPDIDMDFDDVGRARVIEYVTEKYGSDKVAQIVTFGRIKAKNAIKDVIRILDEPYALGDVLTKQLPPDVAGKAVKLYEVFDRNHSRYHEGENFREAAAKLDNQTIIPSALGLEGRMRSTGVHAAGVIISSKNLVETIPIFTRPKDGLTITAFDYPTCESLGLLKFDFLGIRNLTIVAKAVEHVKRIHGITLNAVDIVNGPMDDKKTYELFQRGDTLGIFQLDSAGMRSLLKIFNPTEIGDISAILALYRPGPMGMNSHIAYADRKNGRAPVTSPHPELDELFNTVMGDTFGICTYQEQLMKAAQVVAGYTLAQADNLRRAMGKKKKEVLDKEYVPFSEGMTKNGYSKEAIQALWDIFVPFAEYGFNKSHSAGYALLSYVTAYLKANYPAEYMSALLSCTMTDKDKTATYLEECRRMGIKVSSPHVSKSLIEYTPVSEKEILVGMEAIRGVGYEVAKGIMEAAQEEEFESLTDFMTRVPSHALSKGVIEGLIDAGGFDSFGYNRRSLGNCLPDLAKNFSKLKKTEEKGQFDLFSEVEEVSVPEISIPILPEYPKKEKLARERHTLGLYVSDHPLSGMASTLDSYVSNHIVDIATGDLVASEGFGDKKSKVAFAGVVGNLVRKPSRKGDMFAAFTIEDMTGIVDAVMFPKSYEQYGHLLEPDGIYVARGSLMQRGEDEVNFAIDSIEAIETTDSGEIPFVIKLKKEQTTEESLNLLGEVLQRYKGEQKVHLHVLDLAERNIYELDDSFSIKVGQGLRNEISYLFGVNWM